MKSLEAWVLGLGVVLLALAAPAVAGWPQPLADVFSVILPLCVAGCAICFAVLLTGKRRIFLATMPLAIGALGLLQILGQPASGPAPSDGSTIRIVEFNLWKDNPAASAAAGWIAAQKPDVVVLLEAAGRAQAVADALAPRFPFRTTCRGANPCSTIILSRMPPVEAYGLAKGDADNRRALSAALVRFAGPHPFVVIGVHLSRPLPLGRQQAEIAQLKPVLASLSQRRVIVTGDFNSPRWTNLLRSLTDGTGLRLLPGAASWPALMPFPPFLDLDHSLIGPGWRGATVRRGPELGSDHRPTIIDLRP